MRGEKQWAPKPVFPWLQRHSSLCWPSVADLRTFAQLQEACQQHHLKHYLKSSSSSRPEPQPNENPTFSCVSLSLCLNKVPSKRDTERENRQTTKKASDVPSSIGRLAASLCMSRRGNTKVCLSRWVLCTAIPLCAAGIALQDSLSRRLL